MGSILALWRDSGQTDPVCPISWDSFSGAGRRYDHEDFLVRFDVQRRSEPGTAAVKDRWLRKTISRASDEGVILLRNTIKETIDAVRQGRDSFWVLRTPEENDKIIFDAMEEIGPLG